MTSWPENHNQDQQPLPPPSCYLHCLDFGELGDLLLFLAEEEPVSEKPGDEGDEEHVGHAEEGVLLYAALRRRDRRFHACVPHGDQRGWKQRETSERLQQHTVTEEQN